jgi:molybdopterin/thiamine biosynthesis adenylyltransferase
MSPLDLSRQASILDPAELARHRVTVIGTGSVGSWLCIQLAKLGVPEIHVYDPDHVGPENVPNQLFGPGDVGQPKVEAIGRLCRELAGVELDRHPETFRPGTQVHGIVVSAVDTMAARSAIWSESIRYRPAVSCYLDGRMGGQQGRVYTVSATCDPDEVARYEATLYTDEQASPAPCAVGSIGYTTALIGSLLASQIQKHIAGKDAPPELIFDLATLTFLQPHTERTP